MSDVKRSKLNIEKFGGLFLQAIVKAPPGTNAKNFASISQPLENISTLPTFGQVTTIIQSTLSKYSKGSPSTLSLGKIPSEIEIFALKSTKTQ
ncbi:hypothetical protein VP01_3960g1 [Puccinia sorghi]|uniref:Uncharacterized protein n=1 Tax=Puccinia sorghi TaxID=27349 RepID=A0A0L6USE9_9BASI|nr:hypothetical protein VP01_3960g1 [Puccinia sorghi]